MKKLTLYAKNLLYLIVGLGLIVTIHYSFYQYIIFSPYFKVVQITEKSKYYEAMDGSFKLTTFYQDLVLVTYGNLDYIEKMKCLDYNEIIEQQQQLDRIDNKSCN